jgi:hypothetical protein
MRTEKLILAPGRRTNAVRLAAAVCLAVGLAGCAGGGGGGGGGSTPNPVPNISSLDPSSASVGGASFSLTVNGSNFVSGSVVRWEGSNRATMRVSATQLTAQIPSTDIAVAGSASVTVFSPSPGGGTSNAVMFDISNGVPVLTSLAPSATPAGSADFTLGVNGSQFVSTSVVLWNGSPRATTFVNSTRVNAQILASDVAAEGSALVTVEPPPPGGGTSDPLTFQIVAPQPGGNNTRETATPISNGTISASISPYGDQDFYKFQANAGATVIVEITARRLPSPSQLDSAIEILDSNGNRPTRCKSPDHPRDPNDPFNFTVLPDPEVDFDDPCVCDDIVLGKIQDSRLEFQPAASGTYYIRVVDLRGDGRPDLIYNLTLSGAN